MFRHHLRQHFTWGGHGMTPEDADAWLDHLFADAEPDPPAPLPPPPPGSDRTDDDAGRAPADPAVAGDRAGHPSRRTEAAAAEEEDELEEDERELDASTEGEHEERGEEDERGLIDRLVDGFFDA